MIKKLFLFVLLLPIANLESHEFNPAHLIINQNNNEGTYDATWMYPVKNVGKKAEVIFPDVCISQVSDPYVQGKYYIEKIVLNCSESIKGKFLEIIDLGVLTDALVTINFQDDTFEGLVNTQRNKLDIPIKEQYYPITYLYLGIDHLFDGLDHILFIFGLIFCISGLGNIIKTITAFTVAHSITLGLSIYDLIYLPQGTVEALIALTIIYLALEINEMKNYSVELDAVHSNIVLISTPEGTAKSVVSKLAEKGIDIIDIHDSQVRAVTHLHITDEDIDRAIEAFSSTQ